jgi:hypothetical protein
VGEIGLREVPRHGGDYAGLLQTAGMKLIV